MKRGGNLAHERGYGSAEEAARSKAVVQFGHEVVEGCPCGLVHVRKPEEPGGKRLAQAPKGRADGIPPKVRLAVLKRDGYCCVYCGTTIMGQRYSLGHRVRAAQGGRAVPENLLTFHGWGGEACHGSVDLYKRPDDGIGGKGYRLPSGADPAMEPVLIVSGEADAFFAWLTRDGKYAFEAPEKASAA